MILILKMADGTAKQFDPSVPARVICGFIRDRDVETIVAGELAKSGDVRWEKQFEAVTVMPSDFGKRLAKE